MAPCPSIWLQSACALGQRSILPARLLYESAGGGTFCALISVTTVCGTSMISFVIIQTWRLPVAHCTASVHYVHSSMRPV